MEENNYKSHVFLDKLLEKPDYKSNRLWQEHQAMQFGYVKSAGLHPHHNFLDVACGPLRLGAELVQYLSAGTYFGMDINAQTIQVGVDKLDEDGIDHSNAVLFANETFDFSSVDRPVEMAFSNSLFSHLTLNSIMLCMQSLAKILPSGAAYHSTFFRAPEDADWAEPIQHSKWGRDFSTFANKDPYHYKPSILEVVADRAGFEFGVAETYGHPTQTMAVFTKRA